MIDYHFIKINFLLLIIIFALCKVIMSEEKTKRKPSAYNIFVKDYILNNTDSSIAPKDKLQKASEAWRNHKFESQKCENPEESQPESQPELHPESPPKKKRKLKEIS